MRDRPWAALAPLSEAGASVILLAASCVADDAPTGVDPDSAPIVAVDRFSPDAATLYNREAVDGMPGPNEPIDFDDRFLFSGIGPDGRGIRYYNLDVRSLTPMDAFVFVDADGTPIEEQLPVVESIPGESSYNDIWKVTEVVVPNDYVTNSIVDADAVLSSGYETRLTQTLLDNPIVPDGSTAQERVMGDSGLHRAWHDGEIAYHFRFAEADFQSPGATIPYADIYVCFNILPGEPGGGPPSGFCVEEGTAQTHNTIEFLPDEEGYSPLWRVFAYPPEEFDNVVDVESAQEAVVWELLAMVNCPTAWTAED